MFFPLLILGASLVLGQGNTTTATEQCPGISNFMTNSVQSNGNTTEFQVLSGQCTLSDGGRCVRSPNYPNAYNNDDCCTIFSPAGYLVATDFSVESRFDYLYVANAAYDGWSLPIIEIGEGGNIAWSSDFSVVKDGWEICVCCNASGNCVTSPTTTTAQDTMITTTAAQDTMTTTTSAEDTTLTTTAQDTMITTTTAQDTIITTTSAETTTLTTTTAQDTTITTTGAEATAQDTINATTGAEDTTLTTTAQDTMTTTNSAEDTTLTTTAQDTMITTTSAEDTTLTTTAQDTIITTTSAETTTLTTTTAQDTINETTGAEATTLATTTAQDTINATAGAEATTLATTTAQDTINATTGAEATTLTTTAQDTINATLGAEGTTLATTTAQDTITATAGAEDTTTATPSAILVLGSFSFSMDSAGQVRLCNSTTEAKQAVMNGANAVSTFSITIEQVTSTTVSPCPSRRLGAKRALQDVDVSLDFEISFEDSASATLFSEEINGDASSFADAMATSLDDSLGITVSNVQVEVTQNTVTVPGYTSGVAGAATNMLAIVVIVLSSFFRVADP